MTTNGAAALDRRSAPDSVVGRSASRRGAVVVRGLRKVYPSARRRSWELVRNLRSLGKTILLTTHYMDDAQNLADRVAVLAAGRIVAEGSPETLAGREHGAARVRFRRPTAVAIADLPLPRGVERDSCEMISFRTDTPSRALLPSSRGRQSATSSSRD
jgi:hypothetical protein